MAFHAVAPLLCALLLFFSGGSALSEQSIQMTLYIETPVNDGPNPNGILSVGSQASASFGSIYMHDRSMADGPCPKANIVGRAQAVYFKIDTAPNKNIWSISLSLSFEDASRFNGSTLQVAGIHRPTDCEWSIVGGTGKLSMARGTVLRKIVNIPGSPPRSEELTIEVYYSPKTSKICPKTSIGTFLAIGVSGDTGMVAPV